MFKRIRLVIVGVILVSAALMPTVKVSAQGGERIIYASTVGDAYGQPLISINPDGTDRKVLGNAHGYLPRVSPNGRKIAFFGSNGTGNNDIFVMNSDGTGIINVSHAALYYDAGPDFEWSPDSSKLAYEKPINDNGEAIFTVNADGSDNTLLVPNVPVVSYYLPEWSPDGTKILFTALDNNYEFQGVYLMNADGSNAHLLLNDAFHAKWSPDGTEISFAAYRYADQGGVGVGIMNADGSNPIKISGKNIFYPKWSPDGAYIAGVVGSALVMFHPDGTGERQLAEGSTSWSPDGTQMVYGKSTLTSSGYIDELYKVSVADGSTQRIISEGGYDPVWAFIDDTPSDTVPPVVQSVSWSANPLQQGQNTVLTVGATDDNSGVNKVSYSIDGGPRQPMTYQAATGTWQATFGSTMPVNTYNIAITATDNAGNDSAAAMDVLAIFNPASGYVSGHAKTLPSASDTLPIALDASNHPANLVAGFTGANGATTSVDLQYVITKHQNEFSFSSTAVDWLVIPDSSHASIMVHGDLVSYVNGTKTTVSNVAMRIDVALGTNGSADHMSIKMWNSGLNPATDEPSYQITNASLVQGSQVKIK